MASRAQYGNPRHAQPVSFAPMHMAPPSVQRAPPGSMTFDQRQRAERAAGKFKPQTTKTNLWDEFPGVEKVDPAPQSPAQRMLDDDIFHIEERESRKAAIAQLTAIDQLLADEDRSPPSSPGVTQGQILPTGGPVPTMSPIITGQPVDAWGGQPRRSPMPSPMGRAGTMGQDSAFTIGSPTIMRSINSSNLDAPIPRGDSVSCQVVNEVKGVGSGKSSGFSCYASGTSGGQFLIAARLRVKTRLTNIIMSTDPADCTNNSPSLQGKIKATGVPGQFSVWSKGEDPKNFAVRPRSIEHLCREQLAFCEIDKNHGAMSVLVPKTNNEGSCIKVRPIELEGPFLQNTVGLGDTLTASVNTQDRLMSFTLMTQAGDRVLQLQQISNTEYDMCISHPISVTQGFGIVLSVLHAHA